MNKYLHEKGAQYKQDKTWLLYKKYADKEYTGTRTITNKREDEAYIHTYWTQKGRLFIYNLLKNDGILPLIEKGEL